MARKASNSMSSRLTRFETIAGWLYLPFYLIILNLLLQLANEKLSLGMSALTINIAYFAINLAATLLIFHGFLRQSYFGGSFWNFVQALILGFALYYVGTWAVQALEHLLAGQVTIYNNVTVNELIFENRYVMLAVSVVFAPVIEETLVRGVVSLVESMKLSFKVLSISADALGMDMDEPESKFEKWLAKTFGDKVMNAIMGVAGFLGVVLGIGLFLVLPTLATKGLDMLLGLAGGALGVFKTLCEGLIRIGIFVGYILLVSLMPDIRRTFEYHGAEHKSIACYEAGVELTPENAKHYTRFHPRCGTSFLFVVVMISILLFALVSALLPTSNMLVRLVVRLALLPFVVAISYEFNRLVGRHDNRLTRILTAPGMWFQNFTTNEPDDSMLEVGIEALKLVLPDEAGADRW